MLAMEIQTQNLDAMDVKGLLKLHQKHAEFTTLQPSHRAVYLQVPASLTRDTITIS
jgi:hypothetical protein